ncbi:hypothetical protein GCM10010984_09720 [Chishuiella changwenlii]|uniref:Uncharacterized protein n=1 Tax=Chishuiella changwenlii TaxID=1434701 RepID=A0ABQ1TIF5_9FLAO|nr:hypothetical protein GCM10010984_09720 [Chishuiella changwenlii]
MIFYSDYYFIKALLAVINKFSKNEEIKKGFFYLKRITSEVENLHSGVKRIPVLASYQGEILSLLGLTKI